MGPVRVRKGLGSIGITEATYLSGFAMGVRKSGLLRQYRTLPNWGDQQIWFTQGKLIRQKKLNKFILVVGTHTEAL